MGENARGIVTERVILHLVREFVPVGADVRAAGHHLGIGMLGPPFICHERHVGAAHGGLAQAVDAVICLLSGTSEIPRSILGLTDVHVHHVGWYSGVTLGSVGVLLREKVFANRSLI